jgi:hypothetical protein
MAIQIRLNRRWRELTIVKMGFDPNMGFILALPNCPDPEAQANPKGSGHGLYKSRT